MILTVENLSQSFAITTHSGSDFCSSPRAVAPGSSMHTSCLLHKLRGPVCYSGVVFFLDRRSSKVSVIAWHVLMVGGRNTDYRRRRFGRYGDSSTSHTGHQPSFWLLLKFGKIFQEGLQALGFFKTMKNCFRRLFERHQQNQELAHLSV